MHRSRAFTLVELLVVIGIIAVLIGILMPVLAQARQAATTTKCLANIRNLSLAQIAYAGDNNGYLVRAGLSHGGAHGNESVAWINALQPYYQVALLRRCPADDSPHWSEADGGSGVPVPPSADQFRRSSYGINDFLDKDLCPWGGPYEKITQVRRPSSTIQFLEIAENGEHAGTDHTHMDEWAADPLAAAEEQLEAHQHGGRKGHWDGRANYGFLDGHAETLRLSEVYANQQRNLFDPEAAQ